MFLVLRVNNSSGRELYDYISDLIPTGDFSSFSGKWKKKEQVNLKKYISLRENTAPKLTIKNTK